MAHHLDEQEKIEQLKSFWNRYGKWIILGLSALIIGYIGHIGYKNYRENYAHKAADLYLVLENASSDPKKMQSVTEKLMNDYADTAYASRAALIMAKVDFLYQRMDEAQKKLNWVIENSNESALKTIAQIRLATLLMDKEQYEAALLAIAKPYDEAFMSQCLEIKGDIFRSMGNLKSAKISYQAALKMLHSSAPNYFLLEIKLSDLEG